MSGARGTPRGANSNCSQKKNVNHCQINEEAAASQCGAVAGCYGGMVWYGTVRYHHTVRFVLGGTVPCIDMKNAKQRTVLDTCTLFQIFSRVCVTYGMYHHTYHTIPYMHRRCVCAVHYHVMRTNTYTYVDRLVVVVWYHTIQITDNTTNQSIIW